MSQKIIVSGDREWSGPELEYRLLVILSALPKNYEIIHGACRGVDLTAEKIAKQCGLITHAFPAEASVGSPRYAEDGINMGVRPDLSGMHKC